jgi:hypothetical protein
MRTILANLQNLIFIRSFRDNILFQFLQEILIIVFVISDKFPRIRERLFFFQKQNIKMCKIKLFLIFSCFLMKFEIHFGMEIFCQDQYWKSKFFGHWKIFKKRNIFFGLKRTMMTHHNFSFCRYFRTDKKQKRKYWKVQCHPFLHLRLIKFLPFC